MAAPRQHKKTRSIPLRVGDRVSFVFGGRRVRGTIIEDRGNIGYQGRRLYAVRLKRWPEDLIVEIGAEELRALKAA